MNMEITTETKILVGTLVATVIIIVGGAFWAGSRSGSPTAGRIASDASRLVRSDSPSVGSANAKVTVAEFSDFECPACAVMAPVINQLIKDNAGKSVRFVYRQFPLPEHADAPLAAQASIAAQGQGKFWEYYDMLFANQEKLKRDDLIGYAKSLNLNVADFTKAMDDQKTKAVVDQDVQDGQALNINSTPTFFINDLQYQGDYTAKALQDAINSALAKK